MRVHSNVSSLSANEKNKRTLATSRLLTPEASGPVFRRIQSWQGAVKLLVFHFGVEWIISRYSPPMLEGLLGVLVTNLVSDPEGDQRLLGHQQVQVSDLVCEDDERRSSKSEDSSD